MPYAQYIGYIFSALFGGGIGTLITSWAMRRKLRAEAAKILAEAGEIEERIRASVIESLQDHIEFQSNQIQRLQARVEALEIENEHLRKKLEDYDTGLHKVMT